MKNLIIPKEYHSNLNIKETEVAIKTIKDYFQNNLANALNLSRVSAPLFVRPESGLNDTLNGIERPVSFDIKDCGYECEIVHSLAKWKRLSLKRYGFSEGEGIYTDMNAIRRDEDADNIHSIYVDQWDWEKIINSKARSIETLKSVVRDIYSVIANTEKMVCDKYDCYSPYLPKEITFISAQELEDKYPDFSPKERELAFTKEHGAAFVMQIGGKLKSGEMHDGRAADYDDWELNGDILVYYPVLDIALELSSMGIRVDRETLLRQLAERNCMDRAELPFQKALIDGELPQTIGGGIGQSRMCMLFLRKAHIGEVHASIWPDEMIKVCKANGIELL